MSVSYGGDSITFADNSTISSGWTGFKNRIINGAMTIDQRNAGASVTANNATYPVDRYVVEATQTGKLTAGQNLNGVAPPVGFKKYIGFQSTSSYSVGSGDYFSFRQVVEGYNWSDMAYGTADAKTSTLSFWVYSSLTGTFGGCLRGYDSGSVVRSYPFTYTISSANTWTYISIVVPGDTTSSAAWTATSATTNGWGFSVGFSLGAGSTTSGTAGSWTTANLLAATGSTNVVGTSGATWYMTGLQLEKGSAASSFEYRPFGTELALCQRYYQIASASSRAYTSDGYWGTQFVHKVSMRTTPTYTVISGTGNNGLPGTAQGIIIADTFQTGVQWYGSAGTYYVYGIQAQLNAEL